MSGDDPFGTAAVRAAVLAAWQASPARFREDANAEEDLALGAYRDRVVVELAQNAADAAVRAGVPGRLLLRLTAGPAPRLVAANTGAALDAEGVQALATLRASAKRDGAAVGRFGVGFAAVLGVTDEPSVAGRGGGVRFSRAATLAEVERAAAGAAGLHDELGRRGGHVPALRLPWPAEARPDDGEAAGGYDTVVTLPLRDDAAAASVLAQLRALDDGLLLALPGLDEVTVELPDVPPRVLRAVGARWRVLRRDGTFAPDQLADRPTEERLRTTWSIAWALPRAGERGPRPVAVVHAPTPSDEPLPWTALLVATFPLDPARRHVAPGPATDALVEHAAAAYTDLLAELAAEPALGTDTTTVDPVVAEPWRVVPTGLPAGALDGALREALARRLPGTAFLRAAEDPAIAVRPRDAVALEFPAGADAGAVAALAPAVAGLVLAPRAAAPALDLAGVRRLPLADVVEQLAAPPDDAAWLRLYRGLAGLATDGALREALAALPVPLADGRVVRGAREAVLPAGHDDQGDDEALAAALATLGVRAVRPVLAADSEARRLLERLGARAVGAREALELPAVTAAITAAADPDHLEDDLEDHLHDHGHPQDQAPAVTEAVLMLVAAAVDDGSLRPGDLPALTGLLLPDAEGDLTPAGELVLPGSPAARLLDEREVGVAHPGLLDRWGADVLQAAGVAGSLGVLRAADVPLDAPPDETLEDALDGVADWLDDVAALAADRFGSALAAVAAELVAVRDLDLVRRDAWPAVLDALATDPALRAALLTPVRVLGRGGGVLDVPSYTAWWLRGQLADGGAWADPEAEPGVAALLPAAPPELVGADPAVRAALGGVRGPGDLDAGAVADVLDGLADPDVVLDAATALRSWAVLATLDAAPHDRSVGLVRVLEGDGTVVVDAELDNHGACVVGDPMHAQRDDLGGFVVAPGAAAAAALADLLDLPLADDLAEGVVDETGARQDDVPAVVHELLPGAPRRWCEHDELRVDGAEVEWWVGDGGLVHAVTLDALARGLAWAAGAWGARSALAEVLLDPSALPAVLLDEAFSAARDA